MKDEFNQTILVESIACDTVFTIMLIAGGIPFDMFMCGRRGFRYVGTYQSDLSLFLVSEVIQKVFNSLILLHGLIVSKRGGIISSGMADEQSTKNTDSAKDKYPMVLIIEPAAPYEVSLSPNSDLSAKKKFERTKSTPTSTQFEMALIIEAKLVGSSIRCREVPGAAISGRRTGPIRASGCQRSKPL